MSCSAFVLGILIPCRNEELVVRRKLANLALARWPETMSAHRICVVNDGSTDETMARAKEALSEFFDGRTDVEACVVDNHTRPGKSGAIEQGLQTLEGVDILVLSDADVIVHPRTLLHLASAFEAPEVGMVSGSQSFVRELADDGSARGHGGAPLVVAGNLFDRATAIVRALESRFGRLFSVHGQWLGWRTSLGIKPTPGIAADDIDLALAVRASGAEVRLCQEAQFFEVKTDVDVEGGAQELRRARAYLQVVSQPGLSIGKPWIDRLQLICYRRIPALLPELSMYLPAAVLAVIALEAGAKSFFGALILFVLFLLSPPGRELYRIAAIIRRARTSERHGSLTDSWEMERP